MSHVRTVCASLNEKAASDCERPSPVSSFRSAVRKATLSASGYLAFQATKIVTRFAGQLAQDRRTFDGSTAGAGGAAHEVLSTGLLRVCYRTHRCVAKGAEPAF